jgi:hypothetical protein
MALLSFPASPANGQLYPTTPLPGQSQYEWSATEQTWRLLGVATAVTPGTYGNGTNVGQFTVDATGKITFAQNVPIASGAGGTVTSIVAGTGLTGGTITATGTIALDTAYTNTLYLQLAGGTMTGDIAFSGTQTFPAQNLQKVTDAGNATTNAIDVAGLEVAGMFYPLADGTANQVMSTDGAGNLGWLSTLKVVTAPTASTDAGALGQVAVSTGFLYFYDGTQWLQVAGVAF